jgi:ADP-ribose pyrophosphatase YjhB (NUDIX family)
MFKMLENARFYNTPIRNPRSPAGEGRRSMEDMTEGPLHGAGTEAEPGESPRFSELSEAGAAFRHCPACASPFLRSERGRRWICPDCGFEYFHNVAAAAGLILERDGSILLVVRAREPARGKLALPGGFVEPGESAEEAAMRECREEIGWAPERMEFLASYPNLYRYRGIPYATCDLFFRARAPSLEASDYDCDGEETSELRFIEASRIPWADIAFGSARRALESYATFRSS